MRLFTFDFYRLMVDKRKSGAHNLIMFLLQRETNEETLPLMREESSDGKITTVAHYKVM